MQDNAVAFPTLLPQPANLQISETAQTSILTSSGAQNISVFDTQKMEGLFSLRLMAKHSLVQDVIDDILNYSQTIHAARLNVIKDSLQKCYVDDQNIQNICRDIDILDGATTLGDKIATHYMREQYISMRFDYIKPRRQEIKTEESVSFYYDLPVVETVARFLRDPTLRRYIIKEVGFPTRYSVRFICFQSP